MKLKEGKIGEKQRMHIKKLSVFFSLTVVAIILFTVAIVWSFGVILVATGIDFLAELRVSSGFYVAAVLAASAIIGVGLSFLVGRFVLRPFNDLINGMTSLSNGDYSARISLNSVGKIEPFLSLCDGFNTMARELGNTEVLRSDFINNFSHEFKTPIASINSLIALLKKDNLSKAKRREYLDVIEEETNRLLQMSSNVLYLSKYENEKVLKDVEAFNLSEQIRNCILLLEKKWERKNLSLTLDFDEVEIEANADMLKHVWMNLIDNAVKFSNDNEELRVEIKNPDGYITVRVEDTGVKMSDEERSKIFNKFYQADTAHTKEGNGIGLSIVKHIVELHRGEIFAETVDEKTVFIVKLPQKAN